MRCPRLAHLALAVPALALACGDDDAPPPPAPITYPAIGPLTGAAGAGSFRFGAASAATQIEDDNVNTDWYLWTRPVADGIDCTTIGEPPEVSAFTASTGA